MAAFNKFNCFVQDVGRAVHNLNADTLKVVLTNTAPGAANAVLTDITEIAAGHGYSAGGAAAGSNAFAQTAGTATLTAVNVVFTAAGGAVGPFRYAVLYNATAAGHNLIGWWDYGSSITLADTETFTVSFDAINGVLTLT